MNPRTLSMMVGAVLMAAGALAPAVAGAATITPTPSFVADNHTDDANCSLREAVTVANQNTTTVEPDCAVSGVLGNDTVVLGVGSYVLDIAGVEGANQNATSDIDADTTAGDLTIDGAGTTTTTIDSNLADRVLSNGSGSGLLTVSDLTVTGGNQSVSPGGGIFSNAALSLERARVRLNTTGSFGAGIAASGTSLSISDSVIEDNTATGLDGGGIYTDTTTTTIDSSVIRGNSDAHANSPSGGGIRADNTALTITDSVIADNDATDTDASGNSLGGGLAIGGTTATVTVRGTSISQNKVLGGSGRGGAGINRNGPGATTLINSTVSANEALGSGADGAGVQLSPASTVTLVQATIGPNPVGAGGASGISKSGSGTVNVHGSVVETSGAAAACDGALTSLDDNVFTDGTCGPSAGNDEINADPMLGALADNGGPDAGAPGLLEPIPTHLPADASTVVDHVPAADCDDELSAPLLLDQRGLTRPVDRNANSIADCDAGSVELQVPPPPAPPANPAAPTPAPKKCRKGQKLKKGKCVKKKRKK